MDFEAKFYCQRCNTRINYSEKIEDGYIKGAFVCEKCYDRRPPAEDPVIPGPDMKPLRHPGYTRVDPTITNTNIPATPTIYDEPTN